MSGAKFVFKPTPQVEIEQNREGATHNQNWGEDLETDDVPKADVSTAAMRRAYDCFARGEYPRPFCDRLIGRENQVAKGAYR